MDRTSRTNTRAAPARALVLTALLTMLTGLGCAGRERLDMVAMPAAARAANAFEAWDADRDGRADLFLYADDTGRVDRLGFDRDMDGLPDQVVDLDAIPLERCRHLVLIVEGVSFAEMAQLVEAGRFRFLHPPSKVVASYPAMTDLSLSDLLHYIPSLGYEAVYYDHTHNRLRGSALGYLQGENQAHSRLLGYQTNRFWTGLAYLWPRVSYARELPDLMARLRQERSKEIIAYFGTTAGVVTAGGLDRQRAVLDDVEQFILRVLWETRGMTKITLLADHGHTYTRARPLEAEAFLESRGWRVRRDLRGPRDVVYIRFGLVTFAGFATRSPAALAGDLIELEGVELASYADGPDVVLLRNDGSRARVRQRDGRFAYEPLVGDPLELAELLEAIPADAEGFRDADALLAATVDHVYPAPLQRLWYAHFGLARNPPDVVCSLDDDVYAGSSAFGALARVASTHGGLNRANSVTFIASTLGPLPPVMRMRDIHHALADHWGRPWPLGR